MGKLARKFKRSNSLEMPVTKSEFDFMFPSPNLGLSLKFVDCLCWLWLVLLRILHMILCAIYSSQK